MSSGGSPGRSRIYVNEQMVAGVDLPPLRDHWLTGGRDGTGSVSPDAYAAPGHFTDEIKSVTLDVNGRLIVDTETEMQRLMAQQ